jgi:hypothetical protein
MAGPEKLPAPRVQPPVGGEVLSAQVGGNIEGVAAARELFWQNVIREMLTSLSVLYASKDKGKPAVDQSGKPIDGDMFDGRVAVITTLGQRIPIGAVYPLFACGIQTSDADKALSMAVECTVFQIHTPGGEVFTVPLHEIRAFHSLSEQLIDEIKQASTEHGGNDQHEPFGFAAYTSLARTNLPAEVISPAPAPQPGAGS